MANLLNLCERYFSTRNYYDVLEIPKNANDKQVKKAYYKLSLIVHPDRVKDNIKTEATEKFKVLGGIYSILTNKEKRKLYDQFILYDEEIGVAMRKLTNYLLFLIKKMSTVNDIDNYEKLRLSSEVSSCLFLLKRGNYRSRQYNEFRQYNESRQYEEIKINMNKLIDYLEPSLKEASTININDNDKLSLLFSLQLFLMKKSLISIRQ
ncbi:hypothetical protein ACFW04_005404 [Cataglyphis niger]